ncbi:hypothetical protein [Gemmatimonas sp.]|uniref:hypothetical protein n=1 Tax=Gemmatimonas sp. TaxID=1962908 RepID=UPI003F6E701F
MTRRRAWRRLVLLAASWCIPSGCVYYNGVYNAEKSAKRGDSKLRRNEDDGAREDFRLSAAHAESVLVRHPTSQWVARSLYLAGRGAALAGECETGRARLQAFLANPEAQAIDRQRAVIAIAACHLRSSDAPRARVLLDSLLPGITDAEVRRQARLWAARTALTVGDLAATDQYLGDQDSGLLPWEIASSALGQRDFVRAESILVQRGRAGDFREDVVRAINDFGNGNRLDGAERIVKAYDNARVREVNRGRLQYALGDQLLRGGRDSLARLYFARVTTLITRDTLLRREVVARTAYLELRRAQSMQTADSVLTRVDSSAWSTVFGRQMSEQLLLMRLLLGRDDPSGASAFLAGEVVRDSLRAVPLAAALFSGMARQNPQSLFAPFAWYAASVLVPDSADRWRQRIPVEYPASAVAARLRGEDVTEAPDFTNAPQLLKLRWGEAVRVWSDSVRKLRTRAAPRNP